MGLGFSLFGKPLVTLGAVLAGMGALVMLPEYWPDHRAARQAIERDDRAALERYLARGLDADERSQWRSFPREIVGRTTTWGVGGTSPDLGPSDQPLLSVALAGCRGDMARLLLDAGADPGARGRDGGTPLWHAATCGDAGLVAALLAAGADANGSEPDGGTPLWVPAAQGWRQRPLDPDVVRALEQAGARRPGGPRERP